MSLPGLFITFEGIDGSGKDTVLEFIQGEFYREKSPLYLGKFTETFRTREPTLSSSAGKKLDRYLKGKLKVKKVDTVCNWYIQDRIQHSRFLKPLLKNKAVVLSSRYDLSTFAYQSTQGIELSHIYRLHRYKDNSGSVIPHITLYFSLSAEKAIKRISGRNQPLEVFEKLDFLKKTVSSYNKAAAFLKKKDGRKIIKINADQTPSAVAAETVKKLVPALKNLTDNLI